MNKVFSTTIQPNQAIEMGRLSVYLSLWQYAQSSKKKIIYIKEIESTSESSTWKNLFLKVQFED